MFRVAAGDDKITLKRLLFKLQLCSVQYYHFSKQVETIARFTS